MKKTVNLSKILENCDKYHCISEAQKTDVIAAMKEACLQILNLAADEATMLVDDSSGEAYLTDKYSDGYEKVTIDKNSILDTFNCIEIS